MEEKETPIIIQTGQVLKEGSLIPRKLFSTLPKYILITLSLIIVGELIWGVWYLSQPLPSKGSSKAANNLLQTDFVPSATVSLTSIKPDVNVGEELAVNVSLFSSNRKLDGIDLIIKYDPRFLSLTQDSFIKGDTFPEYVGLSVDNTKGEFVILGLSDVKDEKSNKDGLLGTLKFKAVSKGSSSVSVEFEPGSTTDTNVIDSKLSKDILDEVSNLEVIIN